MLNFNQPVTKSSNTEPQWKILIYDRCGQDIISPLLSVKELRDTGITLHQQLHSDRESIPDVPAIYFVLPTEDNIKRISKVRALKVKLYVKVKHAFMIDENSDGKWSVACNDCEP